MKVQSVAIAFKIGLGFHALNNEGGGGTNVMEPRRIGVGGREYDGISGEMMRRHVLENFVRICLSRDIPLSRAGQGLLPDRGKEDLVTWMREAGVASLAPDHYPAATAVMVQSCALRDVGGYLMALEKGTDKVTGTLKRDSTFEIGWLITGHPSAVDFTQHAAYYPSQQHNLFSQNLRTGVYGGVARFDCGRVGHNDWAWWDGSPTAILSPEARRERVLALLEAFEQYLLSPGGAKQAGWLQHTGLLEGTVMASTAGPAPFVSPLAVSAPSGEGNDDSAVDEVQIAFNPSYREELERLAKLRPGQYSIWNFEGQAEFAETMAALQGRLGDG